MKKLIGLLVVIFIASIGQVFAEADTYKLRGIGPAGGIVFATGSLFGEVWPIDEFEYGFVNSWVSAVNACENKKVKMGNKVFDDWVLPSREVLNLIYVNLKSGKDQFGDKYTPFDVLTDLQYWSSSKDGQGHAWSQSFKNGIQYRDNIKITGDHYRSCCVRIANAGTANWEYEWEHGAKKKELPKYLSPFFPSGSYIYDVIGEKFYILDKKGVILASGTGDFHDPTEVKIDYVKYANYKVGEKGQGGIIVHDKGYWSFDLYIGGKLWRYLEWNKNDQEQEFKWGMTDTFAFSATKAANWCGELNTEGYNDWFLPDVSMLQVIYFEIGGFNSWYWNSNAFGRYRWFFVDPKTGQILTFNISDESGYCQSEYRVRCVRRF